MSIKKAVEHFEWKLDPKNKQWNGTANDFKHYNTIVDYVEEKNKEQFNDNQLFGKLFVVFYGELLKYYEGTVLDTIPSKAIFIELDKSWDRIFYDFIEKHHDVEMALQMPPEIRHKHPLEIRYNHKNIDFKFKEIPKMEIEEAKKNLTIMINNALNTF